jgi:hypothetical protein
MSSAESLNFAQLRTQAKELLRAIRSADPAAVARARTYFDPGQEFRLANAQLVLARELGFPSWAALKRSMEPEEPEENQTARFFRAIEKDDIDAVRHALETTPELASAWRKTPHDYWESALHVAAQRASIEMADTLIKSGAEIYAVRQSGYPPVSDAYDKRRPEMVEFLLNASAAEDHGHPPTYGVGIDMVLATRMGWLDRVEKHVSLDPFAVYRRGCIGESVLHWPAHNGHHAVLKFLIDHGAAIEADEIGLYGGKPLHWAAEHAPESVRILLRNGANPKSRNLMPGEFEGFTPLHMCASQREECIECADQLLEAGADPLALDAKGRTPFDVAMSRSRSKMAHYLQRVI